MAQFNPSDEGVNLHSLDDIDDDILFRDPVYFVEKTRTISGEPFQLTGVDKDGHRVGREYLIEIYRHIAFEASKRDGKPVVIVKGRQVEFSETMLNICLYFLRNEPFFRILYAFPRSEQVGRFSSDRFDGALRQSVNGCLEKMRMKEGKANVKHKQFLNDAQIYFQSAWGEADALRSITCDMFVKDEIQDWTKAAIENTDRAMSHSKYKVDLALGTPKEEESYYHKLWKDSDQRYFYLNCTSCSGYFRITMNNYKYGLMVECDYCHKLMDKRDGMEKGKWMSAVPNPDKKSNVGFHISQLLVPWITKEDIEKEARKLGETSRAFKNEILGEFYGGKARPLEPKDIIEKIEKNQWNLETFPIDIRPPDESVMGIDWGGHSPDTLRAARKGSYTCAIIATAIGHRKYKIQKFYLANHTDYLKQVEEIKALVAQYNCVSIVTDHGYGHVQNQILQNTFGLDIVRTCYSGGTPKQPYKLQFEAGRVDADMDFCMEELYQEIKEEKWVFPYEESIQESVNELIEMVCNVEIKDVVKGNAMRKVFRKTENPNDGLFAMAYARIGFMLKGDLPQIAHSIGNNMPKGTTAYFSGRPAWK